MENVLAFKTIEWEQERYSTVFVKVRILIPIKQATYQAASLPFTVKGVTFLFFPSLFSARLEFDLDGEKNNLPSSCDKSSSNKADSMYSTIVSFDASFGRSRCFVPKVQCSIQTARCYQVPTNLKSQKIHLLDR